MTNVITIVMVVLSHVIIVRDNAMNFIINTDNYAFSPYAITFISSFIISFLIAFIILIKNKVNKNVAMLSSFINFLCSIYCAYLFSVLTADDMVEQLGKISFSSIGGLIGVAVGVIVLGQIYKEYRTKLIKAYTLVIPLMYSISKMGCFLVGCCYGMEYSGAFSVTYHGRFAACTGIELFPVQLLESLVFLIIFLFGLILEYVIKAQKTVAILIIICAISKGLLDFLRASHVGIVISVNQVSCLVIILLTVIIQFLSIKRSV